MEYEVRLKEEYTVIMTWRKPVGIRVSGVTDRKGTLFLHSSGDSFACGEEADDVRDPVI